MKISVALATYNGARYLEAQLDSFLAQTCLPDELIISDDGSKDETPEIVERLAATAPFPVFWSRNERNLGYCGNFNAALLRTTGDLVFLSDQDDVWFPEKIERMVGLAQANPRALVLMNDAALTDAALSDTGLTKQGQIRSAGLSDKVFVMGCCAAVRRELLDLCLPIPEGLRAHDNWIVGIADALERKLILPDVLQYYRRHGNNESQWIVNRASRVTRWDYQVADWQMRLRRWFRGSIRITPTSGALMPPQVFMLQWARRAAERAPEWLRGDLVRYLENLQRHDQVLQKRHEIQRLPFSKRLVNVFAFWRAGGYACFAGFKSAMRDLLSPSRPSESD